MMSVNSKGVLLDVKPSCHLLDPRLLERGRTRHSQQGSRLAKKKKNGELGALGGLAVSEALQVAHPASHVSASRLAVLSGQALGALWGLTWGF